jgi:hypothetical protein
VGSIPLHPHDVPRRCWRYGPDVAHGRSFAFGMAALYMRPVYCV